MEMKEGSEKNNRKGKKMKSIQEKRIYWFIGREEEEEEDGRDNWRDEELRASELFMRQEKRQRRT